MTNPARQRLYFTHPGDEVEAPDPGITGRRAAKVITLAAAGLPLEPVNLRDVVLDVTARNITVERNDRFEDYTTTTYEV
jgi:hypothetical protein